MRLGLSHHFGWAVAVTATDDHQVVDRRRIELIGPEEIARRYQSMFRRIALTAGPAFAFGAQPTAR